MQRINVRGRSWPRKITWTAVGLLLLAAFARILWYKYPLITLPVQRGVPFLAQYGSIITIVVSFITFSWGILYQQKEGERKRKEEREQFEVRQAQERHHFDRKELQDVFKDISDRFANLDNPLMRASAASRLADLAQRPVNADTPIQTLYTMFEPAAAQLAAALVFEPDDNVRGETVDALERLSRFCLTASQPYLLHILINELADSNRRVLKGFTKALAEYEAIGSHKYALEYFTPICRDMEMITSCLDGIKNGLEYQMEKVPLVFTRDDDKPIDSDAENRLGYMLKAWSLKLAHNRDALTYSLFISGEIVRKTRTSELDGLNLSLCFLGDAHMDGAYLARASLHGSYLNGSNLENANMSGASLTACSLKKCQLAAANLVGSKLLNSELDGAILLGTKLYGMIVEEDFISLFKRLRANWWDADFVDPVSGVEDEKLKNYFVTHWSHPLEDEMLD
jgi:hypothetical protein